jgi:hypothetical protein
MIAKAVATQGGEAHLAKVRASRSKLKGTLFVDNQGIPFTGEQAFQLPGQSKIFLKLRTTPKAQNIVQLIDGDKGCIIIDGQAKQARAATLARMHEQLYLSRLIGLTPLLKDREFELTALKETTTDGRPAVGVKVASKGRRAVSLYFDKGSGRLVKVEHLTKNNADREVLQQQFFSGYADIAGIKLPKNVVAFQDGKKLRDVEITDLQFPDSIPAREFDKP